VTSSCSWERTAKRPSTSSTRCATGLQVRKPARSARPSGSGRRRRASGR
jgi:hypothetical protein